jgi:CheY-like chemotaxis protein
VRILLEREGFQVVTAFDGAKGLEVARRDQLDLIALDLDMPVMDGWRLLRQVQSDPDIRDIPIVVVTAHLMPGERNRVIEAGGAGYVSKLSKSENWCMKSKKPWGHKHSAFTDNSVPPHHRRAAAWS